MKKLFLVLALLTGCSSVHMSPEPGVYYKRDIGIDINGQHYEGTVVVPFATKYDIVLSPQGDLDMVLLRTCHREETVEKMQARKFWRPQSSGKYLYTYQPILGLETNRVCPLRIDAYEATEERDSWAHIDFESPDYKLQANVDCNGVTTLINGVGVCQAKEKTVQRIHFAEPVQFAPQQPSGCPPPNYVNGSYEISLYVGECLYQARNRSGMNLRLTTIGYQGVLVREAK